MDYHIDIQNVSSETLPVTEALLTTWAIHALKPYRPQAEITIRLVDEEEITELNATYRKKNKPTNVLAFPATYPTQIKLTVPLLGDVIICPAVLAKESVAQNKPIQAHWAHIVIHGILHLLGHDHMEEEEANTMQAIEIQLLSSLGFNNPYLLEEC